MPCDRTWIEINERALQQNIGTLRALLSGGARFCAIVKANAYGHGLKEVVQIAARQGVDAFGVDCLEDALLIRSWLPSALILTLGYVLPEHYEEAIREHIHLSMYDVDGLRRLEEEAKKQACTAFVHLKIETGTQRQGLSEFDLKQCLQSLSSLPHLQCIGCSTHFANIEDIADPSFATLQFHRFQKALEQAAAYDVHPEYIHCACSAAIILYPSTHGTMVRAGLSLYGVWPSELVETTARRHGIACDLRPILSWKTRVAQVRSVPAGTPIGYGLTETVSKPTRLAVLPVGYWDGYDRRLSSIGEVLVGGNRCKVLGRVCMNMIMVDVSNVPHVEPGQEATLIGRSGRHEISAPTLAKQCQTIPYEILSRLHHTIPKHVISDAL
jgi:alanine racemase